MLKIKTDSNNQIDIENKSIEVSDRVSADGAVTITAKAPIEIKIIKATAAKAIVTEDGEIPISTEDAKSVRKVIGILRAPFAKSNKQNGENGGSGSPETSDEFTYTKTPGKISKLFVHVSEDISNYNAYSDLERMFGMRDTENPKPTLQEICEGKAALPLPLYALYKNNGDVEAAENYLMPMLKTSPADYYYSDESNEGSQFVIVDGDGIERPDLIDEMKNASLSESTFGKKNFLDQVFYAFKHPENEHIDAGKIIYSWPLKLVKENLIKSVVLDVNLTMENTRTDIINVIKSEKDKLGLSNDELAESNGDVFNGSNSGCRAYVLSSDLLFNYNNWKTNEIVESDRAFNEFWAKELNYKTDYAEGDWDSRPSASDNWKGVYVIQKAIEEGRALDIYVKKARTNND